jgi:hypothetical protein
MIGPEARFLFSDDVFDGMQKIHRLICGLPSKTNTGYEVFQAFEMMSPAFNRYLKMLQKLPRTPWRLG